MNSQNIYLDNDKYGAHIKIINYSICNMIDYFYFYHYSYKNNSSYFQQFMQELYNDLKNIGKPLNKQDIENMIHTERIHDKESKEEDIFVKKCNSFEIKNDSSCKEYINDEKINKEKNVPIDEYDRNNKCVNYNDYNNDDYDDDKEKNNIYISIIK